MPRLLPLLVGVGFAVGLLSGFFGIGGGFLIVPGLIGATAMPLINAIGSSLVSVTAFGLTTAASYAWSGSGRLAARRPVRGRRRARRPARNPARQPSRRIQASVIDDFLWHRYCRGDLRRL